MVSLLQVREVQPWVLPEDPQEKVSCELQLKGVDLRKGEQVQLEEELKRRAGVWPGDGILEVALPVEEIPAAFLVGEVGAVGKRVAA